MNKKLQVFISSTYTDLIEERQAAIEAILQAEHIPAGMEIFKGGRPQLKTIYKSIDESDIYMLILGGRYGTIEKASGLSYTELEYKYAKSKSMPIIPIVLSNNYLLKKASTLGYDAIFEQENTVKFSSFKKFTEDIVVRFIDDISQISTEVSLHINDIMSDESYQLVGWTRNTSSLKHSVDFKSLKKFLRQIYHHRGFRFNSKSILC